MMTAENKRIATLEKEFGREALRRWARAQLLWMEGDLGWLVTEGAQRTAYEFIRGIHEKDPNSTAPIVLNIHRGGRKTFLISILAWERCLREPNHIALWIGPTKEEASRVSDLALRFLMAQTPEDLRPEPSASGIYTFQNPAWENPDAVSRLYVLGAKEGAESLRGLRAGTVVLDEFRNFDDPEHAIKDVCVPFFIDRDNPLFVVASTPPRTTGHYFSSILIPQAERTGRYLCIPSSRNPAFTAKEEEKIVAGFGSKDSSAWRREMECELIGDEGSLAIPSFTKKKKAIVRECERPSHYCPFLFADVGYVDATAVLFSYIDFEAQRLVIEDELVATQIGTKALVDAVKAREEAVFGGAALKHLTRRWADATPRELDDLRADGLYFSAARTGEEKWDKWAGIARLESLVREERVAINPRCRHLVFQIENAIKNKHHTDLERIPAREGEDPTAPIVGHWDALWALAYGAWQIRPYWLQDPFPAFVPIAGKHAMVPKHIRMAREDGRHIVTRPTVFTENAGHIGPRT
jgi:hypothetical protein